MDQPQKDLNWEQWQRKGAEVFRITGAFCLLSAEKMDALRDAAKALDAKRIVIDMREVPYMDSAGLGVIALIARYASANDAALVIVPSEQVRKLMRTTGIDRVVSFAENIPSAIDLDIQRPAAPPE